MALLDAMAGASTPVLRADCCSAKPSGAEMMRASRRTGSLSDRGEAGRRTLWSARPGRRGASRRQPEHQRLSGTGPTPPQARPEPDHSHDDRWRCPPGCRAGVPVSTLDWPTETNSTMPSTSAAASMTSRRPTCWWVMQIPSGRAKARLRVVIDCATTDDPRSRATAWKVHPPACNNPPTSHIGRRRFWRRNRRSSPVAGACRVPFCCETVSTAKHTPSEEGQDLGHPSAPSSGWM